MPGWPHRPRDLICPLFDSPAAPAGWQSVMSRQRKILDASFWNSSEDISRVFLSCRLGPEIFTRLARHPCLLQQSLASKFARSAAWLLWRQRSFRTSSRREKGSRKRGPKKQLGPWRRATSDPRTSTRTPESQGPSAQSSGEWALGDPTLGMNCASRFVPGPFTALQPTACAATHSELHVPGTDRRTDAKLKLLPTECASSRTCLLAALHGCQTSRHTSSPAAYSGNSGVGMCRVQSRMARSPAPPPGQVHGLWRPVLLHVALPQVLEKLLASDEAKGRGLLSRSKFEVLLPAG